MHELFCSCIIPTVGRATLSRAVESVLSQSIKGADFEIFIVNDSGKSLPEQAWPDSEKVRVINTNQVERSVARNTGAACANGRFLHFLDDDDWLAPDAYRYLRELSQSSHAKWLYGITQVVDRRSRPLIQLRHNLKGNCFVQAMAGEWIPLQASLIERNAFYDIGGFNPLLKGPEDIDLLRRFLLDEELEEAPNLVAYVKMGSAGSTTDYVQHPLSSRQAREAILGAPNCFRRMNSSAVNSYWRGRMTRVYLTSALWNLQRRRYFTFASRLIYAAACAGIVNAGLLSKGFWQAVSKPYASITFARGIQNAGIRV